MADQTQGFRRGGMSVPGGRMMKGHDLRGEIKPGIASGIAELQLGHQPRAGMPLGGLPSATLGYLFMV